MLKHYIEILIRKYFQECLSPTFTKSTWAKLVRNILTINYMPCTSLKTESNSSFAGSQGQTSN